MYKMGRRLKSFLIAYAHGTAFVSTFFLLRWAIMSTYAGDVVLAFNDYGEGPIEIAVIAMGLALQLYLFFKKNE